MKTVVATDPGILELNFMWLPTWLGLNPHMKTELEAELRKRTEGRTMEEGIEIGHQYVLDWVEAKFPHIQGLREYLAALDKVTPT